MTNGPIRLLLTDVDGTLVTKDKFLTPEALSAVQSLRDAGIGLAITSSRPPRGLRMLVDPLALTTPIAGLNGGIYVTPGLTLIACEKLDRTTATTTVDTLLHHGLDVWIYTETDWMLRTAAAPHVAREAWILKFDPTLVASFTPEHIGQAIKIVGVSDDPDCIAAAENALRAALGPSASVARSEPHFLDVTNPNANKGAVVHTLARHLNITPAQIATIGDMPNDVMMFRQSGLSIAMGNASDEVKAQAAHVTGSNENNGFAKAVSAFVLPGPPA